MATKIIRWTARILGILATFFIAMWLGYLIQDLITKGFAYVFEIRPLLEILPSLVFIGPAIIGFIISWSKERKGAIWMIAVASIQALQVFLRGVLSGAGLRFLNPALISSVPFIIPGLLLICQLLEGKKSDRVAL